MDMEVAGHWRREWAGTAEFGDVTEGGVTRHVARAMEVLHASAPGTRVRVMRAAYHSTAGAGTPAASYLMHSSRRVISSGFNFLEPPSITNKPFIDSPTTPSKPLEISSMPLDNASNVDNTNYKVTEPDDTEISEPSKWKSSNGGSLRFPSEESSSTDNASIVDLDWKRRGSYRKSSCDSESSDFQYTKRNSIDIPIRLSSPSSLSTLRFKSLLSGQQSEWNNRRKSYSFEDTSPINDTILPSNDSHAMESSTDSGICKSTELVNEQHDSKFSIIREQSEDSYDKEQESFNDWLSKNRRNSYQKSNRSPFREHSRIAEDTTESHITLRSLGKVTITVPITVEKDDDSVNRLKTNDDNERKVKRVEFCKTELHFAADTGKVNIIATDDKPPPSNDFRKRRSAFVPLNENFEKPITLFGEKNKNHFTNNNLFSNTIESTENDENTAATKSILKNKIPKPKPYLLGENMAFGVSDELINKDNSSTEPIVPSAVLLINKQLQAGRSTLLEDEDITSNMSKIDQTHRTINDGPVKNNKVSSYRSLFEREKQTEIIQREVPKIQKQRSPSPIKSRYKLAQLSPTPGRAQTRQLRDSDLVYFGVDKTQNREQHKDMNTDIYALPAQEEDIFESVKLVRKISSSVCNSEAESEDAPEYQNIRFKSNFAPVPAPRTSKLNNIAENHSVETRRSRTRKTAEHSSSNRSISEPPKFGRNSLERANRRRNQKNLNLDIPNSRYNEINETKRINETIHENEVVIPASSGKVSPLYVNIGVKNVYKEIPNIKNNKHSVRSNKSHAAEQYVSSNNSSVKRERSSNIGNKETKGSPDRRDQSLRRTRQRTEKLATPEHSDEKSICVNGDIRNSIRHKKATNSTNIGSSGKDDNLKRPANTVTQIHKIISKKDLKTTEDTVKDSRRRGEKVTIDRSKSSHVDRSPSAARKVSSQENTSSDTGKRSTTSKTTDKYTYNRTPEGKSNKYKRSEYVINYDDKNGTVSSICKVTPVQSLSKRHKIPKENRDKAKATDKISLLQLPERDWIHNDYTYVHKKSKKKINIQRSCQLL